MSTTPPAPTPTAATSIAPIAPPAPSAPTTATPVVDVRIVDQSGGISSGDVLTAFVTLVAALVAAIVVIVGYRREQSRQRRERHARAFAEAIQAVHDYKEAPYLVRRRIDGDATSREQITTAISGIQSRLDFHRAWLTVEEPTVAVAYAHLLDEMRAEVGPNITAAWGTSGVRNDSDVPLGSRLTTTRTDVALATCTAAMKTANEKR